MKLHTALKCNENYMKKRDTLLPYENEFQLFFTHKTIDFVLLIGWCFNAFSECSVSIEWNRIEILFLGEENEALNHR